MCTSPEGARSSIISVCLAFCLDKEPAANKYQLRKPASVAANHEKKLDRGATLRAPVRPLLRAGACHPFLTCLARTSPKSLREAPGRGGSAGKESACLPLSTRRIDCIV
jgi:hypothetical protein